MNLVEKLRATALTIAALPGIGLFHEGLFEGRKVRLPVFLGRRPEEGTDCALFQFYEKLLGAVNQPLFREGQWNLCERSGWPDNPSFQNLVAWSWMKGEERYLIMVNLSDCPVQARVQVPWAEAGDGIWHLTDKISGAIYDREGQEMLSPGLYVELGPWNYHFFQCHRTDKK